MNFQSRHDEKISLGLKCMLLNWGERFVVRGSNLYFVDSTNVVFGCVLDVFLKNFVSETTRQYFWAMWPPLE